MQLQSDQQLCVGINLKSENGGRKARIRISRLITHNYIIFPINLERIYDCEHLGEKKLDSFHSHVLANTSIAILLYLSGGVQIWRCHQDVTWPVQQRRYVGGEFSAVSTKNFHVNFIQHIRTTLLIIYSLLIFLPSVLPV